MLRTSPAFSMTRRCLVIAWRVMAKPAVSCAIDMGPSRHSRTTRRSRVPSPSAANTGADAASFAFVLERRRLRKVLLDERHHDRPALLVRRERLRAAFQRDAIEARFADGQHDAAGDLLEDELDQGGRLGRIVHTALDRERMPAEGEQPLRFDAI